jgi:hypothetical protein
VTREGAGKKYAILQREKSRFESRKKKEIPGMCPHSRETCWTGRAMPYGRDNGVSRQHPRALRMRRYAPPAIQDPRCERSDGPDAVAEPISLSIWLAMAETYQNMDTAQEREEAEDNEEQKEKGLSWPQISW